MANGIVTEESYRVYGMQRVWIFHFIADYRYEIYLSGTCISNNLKIKNYTTRKSIENQISYFMQCNVMSCVKMPTQDEMQKKLRKNI